MEHLQTLVQIVPLLVCYMFQPVLVLSSGTSVQKSYKVRYNKSKGLV